MQLLSELFKVTWSLCLTLLDYPARLTSQPGDGISPLFELDTSSHTLNACINSPTRRDCWDGRYDIYTDYEKETPNTGVVRKVSRYAIMSKRNRAEIKIV